MLLRRESQITGKQVPEIILLNSHDGSAHTGCAGLFRLFPERADLR
jgi:hypothetical protein